MPPRTNWAMRIAGGRLPEPSATAGAPLPMNRLLPALIGGQIALHAAMAGQRMAAPLQALQQGHSAWK